MPPIDTSSDDWTPTHEGTKVTGNSDPLPAKQPNLRGSAQLCEVKKYNLGVGHLFAG